MGIELGEIQKVALNEIWKHEERDFTPWLAQNIEKLGEALGGLQLEVSRTEAFAGNFKLDILAKEIGSDRVVVVENQIYKTDHKHLGQLITYASYFKAEIIIWIADEITEEHRSAIDWLNDNTDNKLEFYALEANIIKIDESRPALNFKVKAFPNEWTKSKGISVNTGENVERYRTFFQVLIDELREKHHFTNARKAQPQSWYNFSSGVKGVLYCCSFARGGRVRVEVYIDTQIQDVNQKIIHDLNKDKDTLAQHFDEELQFEELPTKRGSRIALYMNGVIGSDSETLIFIRDWVVKRLLKLREVFGERIKDELKNYDL